MSLHSVAAIARINLRLLGRDPFPFVIIFAMPIVIMPFVTPLFRAALIQEGKPDATGSEYAVPGMAVLFAMFAVSHLGWHTFQEHVWGTWPRLRLSSAGAGAVMFGKALPIWALVVVQQLAVFFLGTLAFGLSIRGSIWALLPIAMVFASFLVTAAAALVAVCRTPQQLDVFAQTGVLLFAGLGNALAPTSLLPGWVQLASPLVPTTWATQAYRGIVLEGDGMLEVLPEAGVILAMTIAVGVFAVMRFRAEDEKAFMQ